MPDFIGLKGDTSDNIKGVPGIGEKTAAELLVQFGVDRGHLRAPRRGRRREAARRRWPTTTSEARAVEGAGDDRPQARRSTSTSTPLVAAPPDRSAMKELFRRLEFRGLLQRLDELEEAIPAAPGERSSGPTLPWREGTPGRASAALPHEVAPGGAATAARRAGRRRPGRDAWSDAADRRPLLAALGDRRVITPRPARIPRPAARPATRCWPPT